MKTAVKSPESTDCRCELGIFLTETPSTEAPKHFFRPLFPRNPHFPALRSSHELSQRPSPQKQIPSIQCKFYLPEHTLSAPDLDSYFAALGDKRFSSGIIISTTDKWGPNAEKRLLNPTKPVNRLRVQDLDDSPIDWSKFSLKNPQALSLRTKKKLRPHQTAAKTDVTTGLAEADRGKLIMACGTGKTFTSLRTAEEMAATGHVLFLVPSLSLLSQSLREWTAEAENPIHALAVCSDVNIGKRSNRDAPGDDDTAVSRVCSFSTTFSSHFYHKRFHL